METPDVIVVGATCALNGVNALCVSSVAEALPHIGREDVTLVIADTARLGGPTTRLDLVRSHAAAGGRVVVLCETGLPETLTWDTPGAVELPTPITARDLAAAIGAGVTGEDADVVFEVTSHNDTATPVTAWKRGNLWFNPRDGQFLVGGAYAREPVPFNSDTQCLGPGVKGDGHAFDPSCCGGFSGFIERSLTAERWPADHVLEVRLSGGVRFGGTPRSDFFHWVGMHQQLVAVELTGVCTDCGDPADFMSGKDRGDAPSVLRERCAAHLRRHTFRTADVNERLPHIEFRWPAAVS